MIGHEIYTLAETLWPINRSITGEGVRQTLKLIKTYLPDLKVMVFKSGTNVFDWTVPKEWRVNSAYIRTPSGKKICDFYKNNLHLVGYSRPYSGVLDLEELKGFLHTLPDQPNAIPYVTSYYQDRWGFCLTEEQFSSLEDGDYEVHIDTELFDGEMNYAELKIKGKSKQEIFLSTYVCHPSMANNELSGPTVLTYLARWLLSKKDLNYSYRIIFIPETIGSIAYLSKNYIEMKRNVFAGFNISCIGDNRCYSYLPSRLGNTISDEIARHVLKWIAPDYKSYNWFDRGSDERQYCSPGIDLPIASIMRSKYGEYPEYHTSLDDLKNVVTPEGLDGGFHALRRAIEALEKNKKFKLTVLCEPQMGKRGLYPTLSKKNSVKDVKLMMDFMSMCDGMLSLLEIAVLLDMPIWELYPTVDMLKEHNLITSDF
jgi:aminopeptidase-like protein